MSPQSFLIEVEMEGMSMSVLGVGVLEPCSGRLHLLQLQTNYAFLSLLLRMRR